MKFSEETKLKEAEKSDVYNLEIYTNRESFVALIKHFFK